MKNLSILALAAVLTLAIATPTAAQRSRSGTPAAVDLKGDETPEQIQAAYTKVINDLAPNLAKADGSPLRTFEATVHYAARPGAEIERAACCKAVATALQTDAPAEAKAWMLKLVAFADRGEVVPVAAELLDDAEPLIRESARYALQHIPTPQAAAALRAALAKATDPNWQAALVLALGTRKDVISVSRISRLLLSRDEAMVSAALFALGNIATSEAQLALASALKTVPEPLRPAAAEAYMKCLEQSIKAGPNAATELAYRRLYEQPEQLRPVRLAALQGMLRSAGDKAATRILEVLASDNADARSVALGFMPDLGSGGLKILSAGLNKLLPATQIMVLDTLAERREKSALPVALAFAQSNDESTRLAGVTALGQLGDASSVAVLVETMQAGGGAASAAKDSLRKLDGAGVNDQISAAMQRESDFTRRADLISVIEARGATVAVPALLPEALGDNATVRRAAMRALGKLASPKDVPTLLKALLKSAPGGERDEAERAIVSVCARTTVPAQQADPVLELYRDASPADRLVLLPVLGRLGSSRALEVVKTALASSDAPTYEAGVNAISNWPDSDSAVEDELLTLAQRAGKTEDRALALRAYLRVISMPSGLPDPEKLKKFQKAMELAERDQERNLVLERVTDLHRIETLRFVLPWLDKPAQAQRACATVVELARDRGLRGQNKAEFEQALNKVLAISKDQGQLERAKRYLGEK